MAHAEVTQFKCDRCGREYVCADGDPPVGWMHVNAESLDHDRLGKQTHEWEICDSCFLNTARYLQPVDRPDNGAHPSPSDRLREVVT